MRKSLTPLQCDVVAEIVRQIRSAHGLPETFNFWKLRGGTHQMIDGILQMNGFDPVYSSIVRKGQSSDWFYCEGDAPDVQRVAGQVKRLMELDESQFSALAPLIESQTRITGRWMQEIAFDLIATPELMEIVSDLGFNLTRLRVGYDLLDPKRGYIYGGVAIRSKNLQTRKKSDKVTLLTPDQLVAIFNQAIAMRGMPLSGLRNAMRELGIEGKLDRDQHGQPVIINYN